MSSSALKGLGAPSSRSERNLEFVWSVTSLGEKIYIEYIYIYIFEYIILYSVYIYIYILNIFTYHHRLYSLSIYIYTPYRKPKIRLLFRHDPPFILIFMFFSMSILACFPSIIVERSSHRTMEPQVAWASFGHHLEVLARHHQVLLNRWWQLLLLKCFACNWLSAVGVGWLIVGRELVDMFWVVHWILFGDFGNFPWKTVDFQECDYQTPSPSWDLLDIWRVYSLVLACPSKCESWPFTTTKVKDAIPSELPLPYICSSKNERERESWNVLRFW